MSKLPTKEKLPKRRTCVICTKRRQIKFFPIKDSFECEKHRYYFDCRQRHRKLRVLLKDYYTEIKDGKSERTCAFIDRFKKMESNHCRYTVVSKFFTSDECKDIKQFGDNKLFGKYKPINFDNNTGKSLRHQKRIFHLINTAEKTFPQMLPCLAELVNVLIECHQ